MVNRLFPMFGSLVRLENWAKLEQDENNVTVIAEQDLPCGVSSLPTIKPIPLKKILKQASSPTCAVKAYVSELNVLVTHGNLEWIHLIRLAENCFEQNIVIHWTSDRKAVMAQTIRRIDSGQELRAWLSPELLSLLNIPFLGPSNIISHQSYRCHRCDTTFNQPNPLKIHIALDCSGLNHQSALSLVFLPPITSTPQPSRHLPTAPAQSTNLTNPLIAVKVESEETLSNRSPTVSTTFLTKEPRTHACVFCGKLYTRKYGLKIHLRTHTGHKPLQCRFCGRPFSDPSNLNKHIRLHSQHNSGAVSSPYKCKKCPKILVRRRDLERHLKSRHK